MPEFDYAALAFWFSVFQWLVVSGIGIAFFVQRRHQATKAEIGVVSEKVAAVDRKHDGRAAELEARVDRIGARMDALATRDSVADVRELLAGMGGDVKAMTAELRGFKETVSGLSRLVNTMHEHLLRDRN